MTMFVGLVLCTLLSVGPRLDPIEGASLNNDTKRWLPSGQHLGSIADLWFIDVTSMQHNGAGGIADFDPLFLSSHGRSWTQTRFLLNHIDITDPGRPGQPMIRVPFELWDRLEHRSSWTATPGFSWQVRPKQQHQARVVQRYDTTRIGGGTWLPRRLFDREPAKDFGAHPLRRHFNGSKTTGDLNYHAKPFDVRIGMQHLGRTHHYLTLGASADRATRDTLLATGHLNIGPGLDILTVWQRESRSHEGAEFRHPKAQTLQRFSNAMVAILESSQQFGPNVFLRLALGAGIKLESQQARSDTPWVRDLQNEWQWTHRLLEPQNSLRRTLSAVAKAHLGKDKKTELHVRLFDRAIVSQAQYATQLRGSTFLQATDPQNRATSMTVLRQPKAAREWLRGGRIQAQTRQVLLGIHVTALMALDLNTLNDQAGTWISMMSPAAGIALRKDFMDSQFMGTLRHEPNQVTHELSQFLDANRPSGTVYQWNDDGDRVPEANETGAPLRRTGAKWHRISDTLSRPSSTQLRLAWRSPKFGPFRALVSGGVRLAHRRFIVRLDGEENQYSQVLRSDPYGEGRAGRRRADGNIRVYQRAQGTWGSEIYRVRNSKKTDTWTGAELQIFTQGTKWWFLSLGLSGYWSIGRGSFGLYADRNDPGIISEVSADPNHRINQLGRFDHDRAFFGNILAGIAPLPFNRDLRCSMVLRYRDGQPMGRIKVIEDLPQGPTAVMASPRGDPMPRFTFSMTLDVRLSHKIHFLGTHWIATIDLHNILGSGTEILENVADGPNYRRSIEMIPGRAVSFELMATWP